MPENIRITKTNIEDVAELVTGNTNPVETINGGDHQVSIWKDSDGNRVIMIQGTGDAITLLTDSPTT